MINFSNNSSHEPYKILRTKYSQARSKKQESIQAISISSYSNIRKEVNSRLVNLKYIINEEFIFFTNYNSPKALEFDSHDQISAILFWPAINSQIRLKAKITKTSEDFNNDYFRTRSYEKNALAISSNQSSKISSFEDVEKNFNEVKKSKDLSKCPEYWGGYSFTPFYFEFWEGHKSRLNRRDVYYIMDDKWEHQILQP